MSISQKLRNFILERDNYTCAICHKQFPPSQLEVDHIQPQSRNGTDDPSNLQTLCIPHNRRKYNWEPIRSNTDENELKFKDFKRWFSRDIIYANSPGIIHYHQSTQDFYTEYRFNYWDTYKRVRHFKTGCFTQQNFILTLQALGFIQHQNITVGIHLRSPNWTSPQTDPLEMPIQFEGPKFPPNLFDPSQF